MSIEYQYSPSNNVNLCNSLPHHHTSSRSIYISGLPGTGKSFTVQRAIQALSAPTPAVAAAAKPSSAKKAPPPAASASVVSVTINCMALHDTKDVYAVLLSEIARALGTVEYYSTFLWGGLGVRVWQ